MAQPFRTSSSSGGSPAAVRRAAGGGVFWIKMTHDERCLGDWSVAYELPTPEFREKRIGALSEGTLGHELWPDLEVRPEDEIVKKYRYSAFMPGTSDLPERLRARGFDTVLITGTVTNVCCESSARDANMTNFRTIMVSDGNAASTQEEHDASLTAFYNVFGDVMDTDMIIERLHRRRPARAAQPRHPSGKGGIMKENRVKRILREGGLALGTHVGGIPDPQIVEIIGLAGFDAAFIDMEHTSFDLHDVQAMVMAAERVGITPIVRTPGFDPAFVLRLLDMGVQGVQVPHVGSAEMARAAVRAVRYPPQGERGMAAGSRAAEYGRIPLVEHMAQSNREILLACMIEDMAAVERIDEIAAVEGVDLLAVGPSDLSRSLGISSEPDHPRLVAAIGRVREAVKRGPAGARLALPLNHASFPRNAAQLRALGAGYTNCAPSPEARLLRSF